MYRYDEFDHDFVKARVAEFSDQVERRLAGEITEDQFRPLRLMNGVYLQLHAYMLRVAVPYGTLNSRQLRMLGHIARKYDKGYGHFTTRQNIQFNWPALSDIPAILADLASVEMHAIQTSGNCIRNVTADHFAGAAADEVADPRPYAEILRQWSSVHPEFSYLPRKFKIAVTGAARDRAAIQTHDIGLHLKKNDEGELGFAVYIGGGQGRTPMVARKIRDFLPEEHLLSYTTAILRVYNLHGRRDNKYKARIKILVHETGVEEIARQVEAEWQALKDGELRLPDGDVAAIQAYFAPPALTARPEGDDALKLARLDSKSFGEWLDQNVFTHRNPDYAAVTISLKAIGEAPGDASDSQMEAVADIAERYGFDEIRVSHEQNLILPHVARADLKAVHDALLAFGLATANSNLISDIIACPGLDYCALANARSISVAQEISHRFASLERQRDIGELKLKISGCINACGHHHVGHIGILGVEKKGVELYQVTLGGSADEHTSVGEIIGRGFGPEEITDAIETIVETYLRIRLDASEKFLDAYRRVGPAPFKEALYAGEAKAQPDAEAQTLAEAASLDALYGALTPLEIIERAVVERFAGEIAVVSSFGADSAVLLHMIAKVDRKLPVIFLDTGKHFGETLDYRDALAADFGLTNIRVIAPDEAAIARIDRDGTLHRTDTDACCDVRKVEPMARGVEPFRAWLTGRKRFQAATRAALPVFEQVGPRFRINPLARWTTSDLADYMRRHALRENPLVAYGYLSIGCFPCTQAVKPGEDARSGRWAGQAKTECGIHLSGLEQSLTDASL